MFWFLGFRPFEQPSNGVLLWVLIPVTSIKKVFKQMIVEHLCELYQIHIRGPVSLCISKCHLPPGGARLYMLFKFVSTSFGYVYLTFSYLIIAIQLTTSPSQKKTNRKETSRPLKQILNTPEHFLEVPEWRSVRPDVDCLETLPMASNCCQVHIKANNKKEQNWSKQTKKKQRPAFWKDES